jgi:hypothetical protein
MPPFHNRPRVESREEFIAFIFRLLDENDAVPWENDTAYAFLQGLAGWLEDADGFYANTGESRDLSKPDWQVFADALSAATVYE